VIWQGVIRTCLRMSGSDAVPTAPAPITSRRPELGGGHRLGQARRRHRVQQRHGRKRRRLRERLERERGGLRPHRFFVPMRPYGGQGLSRTKVLGPLRTSRRQQEKKRGTARRPLKSARTQSLRCTCQLLFSISPTFQKKRHCFQLDDSICSIVMLLPLKMLEFSDAPKNAPVQN
jgi:hypothetical protein